MNAKLVSVIFRLGWLALFDVFLFGGASSFLDPWYLFDIGGFLLYTYLTGTALRDYRGSLLSRGESKQ